MVAVGVNEELGVAVGSNFGHKSLSYDKSMHPLASHNSQFSDRKYRSPNEILFNRSHKNPDAKPLVVRTTKE
jgi:hypothetical protein